MYSSQNERDSSVKPSREENSGNSMSGRHPEEDYRYRSKREMWDSYRPPQSVSSSHSDHSPKRRKLEERTFDSGTYYKPREYDRHYDRRSPNSPEKDNYSYNNSNKYHSGSGKSSTGSSYYSYDRYPPSSSGRFYGRDSGVGYPPRGSSNFPVKSSRSFESPRGRGKYDRHYEPAGTSGNYHRTYSSDYVPSGMTSSTSSTSNSDSRRSFDRPDSRYTPKEWDKSYREDRRRYDSYYDARDYRSSDREPASPRSPNRYYPTSSPRDTRERYYEDDREEISRSFDKQHTTDETAPEKFQQRRSPVYHEEIEEGERRVEPENRNAAPSTHEPEVASTTKPAPSSQPQVSTVVPPTVPTLANPPPSPGPSASVQNSTPAPAPIVVPTPTVVVTQQTIVTTAEVEIKEEKSESPTTPQPSTKRRLTWGQGLAAFEKKKTTTESGSTPTSTPKLECVTASEGGPNFSDALVEAVEMMKTTKALVEQQTTTEEPVQVPATPTEAAPVAAPMEVVVPPVTPVPEATPSAQPITPTASSEDLKIVESTPQEEPVDLPSKEEVLLSIERIDAEIGQTEQQIHNLKKPKKPEHKHKLYNQNMVQRIYEENKERIQTANDELMAAFPGISFGKVLYKNPADLPSYQENIQSHDQIKGKMSALLLQRKKDEASKQSKLTDKYKSLLESWKKNLIELEQQRKITAQKKKEEEEKMLEDPYAFSGRRTALRSVRVARGRGSDAVRSEAEFDEIMLQLRDAENHDPNKYKKTLAIIPPMSLANRTRYIDNNGFIEDPVAVERERKQANPWSEEEKMIFVENFTIYPKNFPKIASYLEDKTTADVIWFYYTNKKTLDLKRLLKDQQQPQRKRPLSRKEPVPSGLPRELRGLGITSSTYWSSPSSEKKVKQEEEPRNRPSILGASKDDPDKWTEYEKSLLMEGIKMYPKDFKSIAQHVGTKSSVQCKAYYQTIKKKISLDQLAENIKKKKGNEKEERRTTAMWSTEEKNSFMKYLSIYGKNWKKLSSLIVTKTSSQIKNFFQNYKVKLQLDQLIPDEVPEKEDSKKEEAKKRARKQPQASVAPEKTRKRRGKSPEVAANKKKVVKEEDDSYEENDDESSQEEEVYEQPKKKKEEVVATPTTPKEKRDAPPTPTAASAFSPKAPQRQTQTQTPVKAIPEPTPTPKTPATVSTPSFPAAAPSPADPFNESDLFLLSALALLSGNRDAPVEKTPTPAPVPTPPSAAPTPAPAVVPVTPSQMAVSSLLSEDVPISVARIPTPPAGSIAAVLDQPALVPPVSVVSPMDETTL